MTIMYNGHYFALNVRNSLSNDFSADNAKKWPFCANCESTILSQITSINNLECNRTENVTTTTTAASCKMESIVATNNDKINNSTPSNPAEEPLLGSLTTYNNIDGAEIKSQTIRSSARVFKKMKLELTPSVQNVEQKPCDKKEDAKQDTKKYFRPIWTSDEKNIFFEALNEFGKDFESIQSYISSKLKKKGLSDSSTKTKDQVRQLYYRTWNNISKYLKFPEGIKKSVQELYALINYGEMRKKVGSLTEKTCIKLNDLIYTGFIVLRVKGKSIRIKTPMCRALRRLNQLDEKYDEINLPTRITVEMRPKDMNAYLRVQNLAQNPRLRTVLPLQKRLSSIISCLSKKWRSFEAIRYDKAIQPTIAATNDCIPNATEVHDSKSILSPAIRLAPPPASKIEIPTINVSEYFSRQSICFTAYENRVGLKIADDVKLSPKKGMRQRADSISKISKEVEDELNTTRNSSLPEDLDSSDICDKSEIQRIRLGWNELECQALTVGELYLMFGRDSKLVLEFSWDESEVRFDSSIYSDEELEEKTELSYSLSKLLSVAKLHYRKNIIKCPCGHICGSKSNVQLKRAMESKIRKILTDIDKCTAETEENKNEENMFETSFVTPTSVYHHPINPNLFHGAASSPMVHLITQLRNGKKPRAKKVVVERKLPLLPNDKESGHQIVRMNIISQQNETKASTSADENLYQNIPDFMSENAISTAPTSPTGILKQGDDWMEAEVADYSLSSLLGHLGSPMKTATTEEVQDMEAQLHSMLTQSSLDFSANFADLAAQVGSETDK